MTLSSLQIYTSCLYVLLYKPFASLHHTCIWYSRVDRRPNVCKYFARGPGNRVGSANIYFYWHGAPHVNGAEMQYFLTTDMGLPMSMDQFPDALTWGSPCQWTKNSIFSNHWHGAPHVNGPISRRTDMGLPMSMDQKFNIFRPLTWGSPCQWTNFQTHWHGAPHVNGPKIQYFQTTDMGLPMSMDQFPDALTWGPPCQWTKNSILSNYWHGAPHVNGPISRRTDMGLPMSLDQNSIFSDHWHGAPHVNGPFSRRTDMGLPMSMDQKINIFRPLTWGSPWQWTNFQTHWHEAPQVNGPKIKYFQTTDMELPMSMDQFPDALTWGSPCQWTKNSIFLDHWHGAPHVNGPISRRTDMGLPMSATTCWRLAK